MDQDALKRLLKRLQKGEIGIDDAMEALSRLPYEGIDNILFDHHREVRKGLPEIVYGPGKSSEQLLELAKRFTQKGVPFLITRLDADKAEFLINKFPSLSYDSISRCLSYQPEESEGKDLKHGVLIVTAGTADLPVAKEAKECLKISGISCQILSDVGVAGIHRMFDHLDMLRKARVIIAVAGMEGALPSVIAGIVRAPVIAVPTSTGYGANLGGIAPLLAMLNSCAPGIGVVNIDNGVGAALLAASIINSISC